MAGVQSRSQAARTGLDITYSCRGGGPDRLPATAGHRAGQWNAPGYGTRADLATAAPRGTQAKGESPAKDPATTALMRPVMSSEPCPTLADLLADAHWVRGLASSLADNAHDADDL